MTTCYAQMFGDCNGAIEDEHFLPQSLQRMFGSVVIAGMAWQHGERSRSLPAGTYGHSRILCQKHHDDLDGLDGNAAAYFKNLMFMAGGQHLASGAVGRATDVTPVIDGRALERWFLKVMCGAVVTGSIEQTRTPPEEWVAALFERITWPEQWAMYFATGNRRVARSDGALNVEFHWRDGTRLNGLVLWFMTMATLFGLEPPDRADGLLRRPTMLGAEVQRDHGGPALEGLALGEQIRFELVWQE